MRPTLAAVLIPALTGWTPSAVEKAGKDRGDIRATEKLVRALMYGFERSVFRPISLTVSNRLAPSGLTSDAPPARSSTIAANFKPQLQQALLTQNARMEVAYRLQLEEARVKRAGGAVEEPSAKRVKIEAPAPPLPLAPAAARSAPGFAPPGPAAPRPAEGPIFDVQLLTAPLVIDLALASIESLSLPALSHAVGVIRQQLAQPEPTWSNAARLLAPCVRAEGRAEGDVVGEAKVEDGEGSNPLDMRLNDGERDEDVLPDLPPAGIDGSLASAAAMAEAKPVVAFSLPPPQALPLAKRQVQVLKTLARLLDTGAEKLASQPARAEDDESLLQSRGGVWELWMVLGSRLVTRSDDDGGAEGEASPTNQTLSREREAVAAWVADDFVARSVARSPSASMPLTLPD